MGWADAHIEKLLRGERVSFRPRGNSMLPKIKSGQLVTVEPRTTCGVGDVVLVKVKGNVYLHYVRAFREQGRDVMFRIENASGHVNGWVDRSKIYGVLVTVED